MSGCRQAQLLSVQEEEAKGEGKLSSLTKDADREVKKTYGTLGGMLAHHLMQAMQLGGSAGRQCTSATCWTCIQTAPFKP